MSGRTTLTDAAVCAAAEDSKEDLARICETLQSHIQLMVIARLSPTPAQCDGVDDISQDVLLGLAEGISRLKNRTVNGLKAFLSGIVTRQVAAWIRKRRKPPGSRLVSLDKTISTLSSAAPLVEFLSLSGASPRTQAEQAELAKGGFIALGRLEPEDREIITLAVFDQLRTGEIASIKGISREAAYMRFRRAMERWRRNVKDPGSTDAAGVARG